MLSSVGDLRMIYIDGEFQENVLKGFHKKMLFTTLKRSNSKNV